MSEDLPGTYGSDTDDVDRYLTLIKKNSCDGKKRRATGDRDNEKNHGVRWIATWGCRGKGECLPQVCVNRYWAGSGIFLRLDNPSSTFSTCNWVW